MVRPARAFSQVSSPRSVGIVLPLSSFMRALPVRGIATAVDRLAQGPAPERVDGSGLTENIMRRIVASAFLSMDGVMQAPGGPEEDPTGGFTHGGWVFAFFDEAVGAAVDEVLAEPYDLLLGRGTYDIFAAYWPHAEVDPASPGYDEGTAAIANAFNRTTKYVATHRPETLSWANSEPLGDDILARLKELKADDGPRLLIQGSGELFRQLLAADLVDEITLMIFPLVLGRGKRLFGEGAIPAAFRLVRSTTSPGGAVIATYERAGEVKTGSFAMDEPSEAELERRRRLA